MAQSGAELPPMTQRMTSIAGLTIAMSYGISRGLAVEELCEAIGIDPLQFGDPLRMIPFTITERLWRTLVARLPNDNVGVGIGKLAQPEHYGFLGQFLRQARNGLELVQMMARSSVVGDSALVANPARVEVHGEEVHMTLPMLLSAGIPERSEAVFVAVVTTVRSNLGSAVAPLRAQLSYPWDARRELVRQELRCSFDWDAEADMLVFDRTIMLTPFPNAQPNALAAFNSFLERKAKTTPGLTFAERVRQVVELQVARGDTTQQATALALGMSVRSLQRELQTAGIRYSDLLGEALKTVVTDLMREGEQSLEGIALSLGYSELSSFSRSWKRLTGESPARYRMRLLGLGEGGTARIKASG